MKDKLLGIFLAGFMLTGTGLFAQKMMPSPNAIDVSQKSAIRFNMDKTTEAERDALNKQYHDNLIAQDPKWDEKRNAYETMIQQWLVKHPSGRDENDTRTATAVITVPVVIHIVWNSANPSGNISDAQATSQIGVLNQDYGRTNTDAGSTPSVWKSVAANLNIQFCLAQRTPAGAATTGIERKENDAVTSWGTDNAVKAASTGGLDAWDPTKYLNIWVCDLGQSLLGYGEFPTGTVSQTYGVVILNTGFGNTGTVSSPYQLGRTTTHEFSHCFNMYHIWGDDGTACTGTDYCSDTPNQAGSTTTCPTFPLVDACGSSPAPNAGDPVNGIMFMDYMDYSYDNCMNMFTAQQSARANAVISTAPYNALASSNGCTPLSALNNDAGISSITTPTGTLCNGTYTPVVVLKNFGVNAITSCTIKYKVDAAGAVSTFNYTGSLAASATTPVTLPSVTTANGAHIFYAWSSMPNGVTDTQPSNDSSHVSFTIAGGTGLALPFSEGFEGTTFVPAGWVLNNPDAATTWARTTAAFKTGTASAYMDDFNYSAIGQKDDLVTPGLKLSSVTNPVLTFEVAYTYATNGTANNTDSLNVQISTDCGSTWKSIYKKGGATLATVTPTANAATNFTPTAAQWRLETVSLSSYSSAANAMIKFTNVNGYGDDMYIDDVNVTNVTGIENLQLNNALNVYPNPTSGQLSVALSMPVTGNFQVRVLDVMGRTISTISEVNSLGGTYNVDLSQNANGLYFVEVITDGATVIRKVLLDKK